MEQPPATAGIVMANWYWKVVRQFVSERFGISLCRSSCLNWLHRLGFAFKRPKKRLLKANESKREAFVAEYAARWEEAQRTEASIFFADEAHFRADAELRGLNWLHRLGFAFKRPKKRLLKANESKREAFVAEYAARWEEAQRTEASIFFADEAHFGRTRNCGGSGC